MTPTMRVLCDRTPETERFAREFEAALATMLGWRRDLRIEASLQREGPRLRVIAHFVDGDGAVIGGAKQDFSEADTAVSAARAVAIRFADVVG